MIDKNNELDNVTTIKFVLDRIPVFQLFLHLVIILISMLKIRTRLRGKSYSISRVHLKDFSLNNGKRNGQFSKYLTNLNVGDVIKHQIHMVILF